MKTISAREARNGFDPMRDAAGAEPVLIEQPWRGVIMVISGEEYEHLYRLADDAAKAGANVEEAARHGR